MQDITYSGSALNGTLDNPNATLAQPLHVGDDSAIVAGELTGWPNGADHKLFVIEVDTERDAEERILCSQISGAGPATFTIVQRGFDGTAESEHAIAATVFHVLDAGTVAELVQHVIDSGRDDHCFSEDTEILTEEGWLGIDALEVGIGAWTFDLATERAELEPIAAVYRYPAEKFPTVLALTNGDLGEVRVTHEHSIVWKRRGKPWRTRPARTLPQQFLIPASADGGMPAAIGDAMLRVVAWAATEGHWNASGTMTIAQKDGPLADRLREALADADLDFGEYKQRGEMRAFRLRPAACERLRFWLDAEKVPRRLDNIGGRQARVFLGEAVLGDGHVPGGAKLNRVTNWLADGEQPYMVLASNNGRFVDFVQAIAARAGIKSRAYYHDDVCRVSLKATRHHDGISVDEVPNERDVWCVSVPEHRTLICRRPGKSAVFIAGNTQYLTNGRHDTTERHTFGDAEALGTPGAPADVGTTAGVGLAETPARWDHVHELGEASIDDPALFGAGIIPPAALQPGIDAALLSPNTVPPGALALGLGVLAVANSDAIQAADDTHLLLPPDPAIVTFWRQPDKSRVYVTDGTEWRWLTGSPLKALLVYGVDGNGIPNDLPTWHDLNQFGGAGSDELHMASGGSTITVPTNVLGPPNYAYDGEWDLIWRILLSTAGGTASSAFLMQCVVTGGTTLTQLLDDGVNTPSHSTLFKGRLTLTLAAAAAVKLQLANGSGGNVNVLAGSTFELRYRGAA